ncbi:hypothetical protein Tco_0937122 [Tanacetum coccineum]|uniref:Uncharacterized protein n=1 Tax=Tanacetum coccineum TaxID=301880 RepID=A0ABQ5DE75_9ASTR
MGSTLGLSHLSQVDLSILYRVMKLFPSIGSEFFVLHVKSLKKQEQKQSLERGEHLSTLLVHESSFQLTVFPEISYIPLPIDACETLKARSYSPHASGMSVTQVVKSFVTGVSRKRKREVPEGMAGRIEGIRTRCVSNLPRSKTSESQLLRKRLEQEGSGDFGTSLTHSTHKSGVNEN